MDCDAPIPAPAVLLSGVVLGQPMGGVRRQALEVLPRAARLLAQRGGRLTVLEGAQPLGFELPPEARRVRTDVPAGPPLVRALAEGRAWFEECERARGRGEPHDLLHSAHLPTPPRSPLPYAFLLHDLRAIAGEMAPFARRLIARGVVGRALRGAAAVLTVSETVRAELLARFRLDPEGVVVVPNAADHFEPLPRAAGRGAPLVCIGHLEPRKNLELVLSALALDQGLPHLVLHGAAKAGEETRLRALAQELGVTERVDFAGPFAEAELPGLLAGAAALVLPSRIEGFGIGALEAQRARTPLAIAAAGALPEVAGPLTPTFPPDDAAACAAAIRRALAATPAELEAAAQRAARYAWDDSARRLVEAWELAHRRRGLQRAPLPERPGPRRSR